GRQLGFGDWDFFAVWSLVFGVFIPVFAAYLGFGFWDLEFSMVSAADSFKRMSPALARRLNIGPPPLILPRRLPGFCSPDTVVVTGIALTTFPPLLSASRSTATERGSLTVMSPPETSRWESALGCAPRPTMIGPLEVCASTTSRASFTSIFPPEFLTSTLPFASLIT